MDGFWDGAEEIINYEIVTLSDTPVTLISIALFIVAILGFYIGARLVGGAVTRYVLRHSSMDRGLRYAIGRTVQYSVLGIGLFVSLQLVGVDMASVAIILGAFGVGIGLGLQGLVSNFIAGVILLFERPIKVGDRVLVGETEGDVEQINMRATTIRSVRNESVIVPNSDFVTSTVVNWSHGDNRIIVAVDVGVSYASDLDTVVEALMTVAQDHREVLANPVPEVRLVSFGDSSWDMRLLAWIGDANQHLRIASELKMDVVRAFRARDVEIPFPQRDIHVRSHVNAQPDGASN